MKLLKLWDNPMLSIEDRLEAAQGEVERLHNLLEKADCSVKKANEQAEHFEREWYLRGDLLDKIQDYALEHSTGPAVPDALWEICDMISSRYRAGIDVKVEES